MVGEFTYFTNGIALIVSIDYVIDYVRFRYPLGKSKSMPHPFK
jgi:hypothetical protein